MSDIPENIYLCFGEDGPGEDGDCDLGPLSWGDVTWADACIDETDVKYIRYSSYCKMERELRDQIKYLIAENSIQSDKE